MLSHVQVYVNYISENSIIFKQATQFKFLEVRKTYQFNWQAAFNNLIIALSYVCRQWILHLMY